MAELALLQGLHIPQGVQDGIPLCSGDLQPPQGILCCKKHLQNEIKIMHPSLLPAEWLAQGKESDHAVLPWPGNKTQAGSRALRCGAAQAYYRDGMKQNWLT